MYELGYEPEEQTVGVWVEVSWYPTGKIKPELEVSFFLLCSDVIC